VDPKQKMHKLVPDTRFRAHAQTHHSYSADENKQLNNLISGDDDDQDHEDLLLVEFDLAMDPELIFQVDKLDETRTKIALDVIRNIPANEIERSVEILVHVVKSSEMLTENMKAKLLDPIYPIRISLICTKSGEINIFNRMREENENVKRAIFKVSRENIKASPRSNCNCAFCLATLQADPSAVGIIASLYYAGFGVDRDEKFALELYDFACRNSNNPEIKYEYGIILVNGDESSSTEMQEKGEKLIKEAANGGYVKALRKYASMLHQDDDSQNISLAKELYYKAILQLDPISMFNYAVMILDEETNEASPISPEQEGKELELIAKLLNTELTELKKNRSPSLKNADMIGWLWIECAASLGMAEAQFQLAKYFSNQSQPKRTFSLLEKAAHSGHLYAQYNLAVMYFHGNGIQADLSLAFSWFLRAAKGGLVEAQFAVGMMYTEGFGIAANIEKAKFYMKKVYRSGDIRALSFLEKLK
jgi:TPR repeat protein